METEREIQIRNFKRNSNKILHERNIYGNFYKKFF